MNTKEIHRKTMNWDKNLITDVTETELPGLANEYVTNLTDKLHYLVRRGLQSIKDQNIKN